MAQESNFYALNMAEFTLFSLNEPTKIKIFHNRLRYYENFHFDSNPYSYQQNSERRSSATNCLLYKFPELPYSIFFSVLCSNLVHLNKIRFCSFLRLHFLISILCIRAILQSFPFQNITSIFSAVHLQSRVSKTSSAV